MRAQVFFLCLLVSAYTMAESTLPAGCQAVAVQGESVTLKSKKLKLVFIHNLIEADLWITHPAKDSGAATNWTSRLQGGNWSAFVMEKGPFILNCIESKPGHEQQIPCEGAIAVCQWKKVKIPASQKQVSLVGEDMSLHALTAAIGSRGIAVPTGP